MDAKSTNKDVVEANFIAPTVIADKCDLTLELYNKSRYGEPQKDKFHYSLPEALYLLERGKFKIKSGRTTLNLDKFLRKANKVDPNFLTRYSVFKDLRKRGYIVKTALKFGADFRVYDRGIKPGEDHALWVVFPVSESEKFTWFEFAAKNRVAHSTKKKVLLGIVDAEQDVTYYEVHWKRP